MSDILSQVEQFQGKRNSVISLFVPPDIDFRKHLDSIERSVKAIKHSKKRGQIMSVLRCISEHIENVKKFDKNGVIICCGMSLHNTHEYYELLPPNKIEEFEYYYDYVFNIQRIREIYNRDVIVFLESTEESKLLATLEKHIADSDHMVVLGLREIDRVLESRVLSELYYFSNDAMEQSYIEKIRSIGGKIYKIDMSSTKNIEFSQKYGKYLGLLHYPIDLSDINNHEGI